jgi:hypothetical protein
MNDMNNVENARKQEEILINNVWRNIDGNLSLTLQNTGGTSSRILYIELMNKLTDPWTQNFYKMNILINPGEANSYSTDIPIQVTDEYTISLLTEKGNQYYTYYPLDSTYDDLFTGYYFDYSESDLHLEVAIGSHSHFSAMKGILDGINNILIEGTGSSGGYTNQTLIDYESFEGSWPPSGWSETPSSNRWNQENELVYDGTWSADFDGGGGGQSGNLETLTLDCSNARSIYVDFWYYDDDLDSGEFTLEYYDGTTWDYITDLGTNTEDTWHKYQQNITDSQYLITDFKIRWVISSASNGEKAFLDYISIKKEIQSSSFEIDLEVYWSNLPQTENEWLTIYGYNSSETLKIDVWNGTEWITIIPSMNSGWNNVNVSKYHTSSDFCIRFKDTMTTLDIVENSWEIDLLALHLWDD